MKTTFGQLASDGVLEYSDGYRTKKDELDEDGFRILRVADIHDGWIGSDGQDYVDSSYESKIGQKFAREGDILLTTKGTIGRIAIVPDLVGEKLVYSPQLCFFRVRDHKALDPPFLRYWLASRAATRQIGSLSASTDMAPYLSLRDIRTLEVDLPDLATQRAIGEVLGALDDKIAANRRVQHTIDDLLEASFHKVSRSASERVELGDLIALNYGKSLPASKRIDGPVPVVGSGGVVGYHDEPLVDGPAVVVGRKGSVGSTYWINEDCYPIDTTYWVTPLGISLGYAYRLLQSIDFVAMNTDSAVPGLNRERAYALQVALPLEGQLEEFDRLSEELTLKHSALQVETAALARTRDELLPLLMNGRITVKDAERAAEDVL